MIFKYQKIIILVGLLMIPIELVQAATTRLVHNTADDMSGGTLRVTLQDACDTSGDDIITFAKTRLSSIEIKLNSTLVIPQDCKGNVELTGSSEVDSILNASKFKTGGSAPGDSCIIAVYSDDNSVSNFSFINNSYGAGICLFGKNNTITNNRLGTTKSAKKSGNLYGIVISNAYEKDYPKMNGSGNTVSENTIRYNSSFGIWVEANDNTIGGDAFDDSANTIRDNSGGGIAVSGEDTSGVHITHNAIYNNGDFPGIDLAVDGLTDNDAGDSDTGPNGLINRVDRFQAFPLVPALDGTERYWSWGVSFSGDHLEMYEADATDAENNFHGGGKTWLLDASIDEKTFSTDPDTNNFEAGQIITLLNFDTENNTSEYALNIYVGTDEDMDGVIDDFETGDGTEASEGSSPDLDDSDGDGLPDSVEDKNRNGIWDKDDNETSAYLADSDEDGLDDWFEVRGDETYENDFDTNPLEADTDGDGLPDGDEDANHNGVWEGYLRETSPLLADSDGDGINDDKDDCPSIYNPGQEDFYCQE